MNKIEHLSKRLRSMAYTGAVLDTLIVILIYFIGQFVVVTVIRSADVSTSEELYQKPQLLVGAYIFGGLITLVCIYVAMRYRKMSLRDVSVSRPRYSDIGYGILGFGAYFLIVRLVMVVVDTLIPAINLDQAQNIGLKNVSSDILPFAFLALAILPPLSEELLFRGFFLHRLLKHKVMPVIAALFVSTVFGVMHGQWNVGIDTFVLSMVMIYTFSLRRSLWVTITIHMIKNTLAFLALFIFKVV